MDPAAHTSSAGPCTSGPRWLRPELLVVASYVASCACLCSALVGAEPLGARGALAAVVATAVVAATLARLSLRPSERRAHDVRCLVGAVFAGVGLWGFVHGLGQAGIGQTGASIGVGLALGATIGLPASIAAGVLLALLVRTARSVRLFPTVDALERVGIVAGAAAGLAGATSIGFTAPRLLAVPLAAVALGLGLLAMTWRRDVKRAAWLRDVYAGNAEGFAIVPLDETQIRDHVDSLVPGAAADAVLVHEPPAKSAHGPYRATPRPRVVALAPREVAPSVAPIRTRVHRAALLFTLTLGLGAAAGLAQAERARAERPGAHPAAPPVRISCQEARGVFEYRAREVAPVTRALFLGHAQDPSIPVGEAHLFLATAEGKNPSPDVALKVLDAVGQIPCAGMPLVSARAPIPRDFRVSARLSIDQGENAKEVAVWVRRALEDAFTPSDTSAHESVQFGYHDRKLRWRVAATISQTEGVRSYELSIDGQQDVSLAPAELAHLAELTLIDAATGERL